jgi:hypothetical protein
MPTNSSNSELERKLKEIMFRLGFIYLETNDEDVLKATKEAYTYVQEIRDELDVLIVEEVTQMYLELEESMKANELDDEQHTEDTDKADTQPYDEADADTPR